MQGLRKGDVPTPSEQALRAFNDAVDGLLNVRPARVLMVEQLAPIHNNSFDRMLVAQALAEPLTLIPLEALVASTALPS